MLNMRMFVRALPTIGLCLLLCGIGECIIEPPGPEDAGPGNNTYICDTETGLYVDDGSIWFGGLDNGNGGWIYAPSCSERSEEAPVVFFFTAWSVDTRAIYDGFFRHLAGKGYIVIAPKYNLPPENDTIVGQLRFYEALLAGRNRAIRSAYQGFLSYMSDILPTNDVPAPMFEEDELVYGVVGHSMGGSYAAAFSNPTILNSVIDDENSNLSPKVVVTMDAGSDLLCRCPGASEMAWCFPTGPLAWLWHLLGLGGGYFDPDWSPDPLYCPYGEYQTVEDGQHCMATEGAHLWGDLSAIDYNPLWIQMVGERDIDACESAEMNLFCSTTQITDKQYLRVRADDHGRPSTNDLKAHHFDPAGADLVLHWTGKVDGHDYYGYWKIVTAAMNCAIHGQDCNYARGGTNEQLSMGNWSDGEPVKRMQWNPNVRDNDGICYPLEDACDMVNYIDPVIQESAWNWRGSNIPADCGD